MAPPTTLDLFHSAQENSMVIKLTAIVSLGLALTVAGSRSFFPEPPAYSWYSLDPAEIAVRSKYLDGQFRAREYFIELKDGILKKLARGELSLPQACDRLIDSARTFYPSYLRFLGIDTNMPLKENLARNLVASFRREAEDAPSFVEVALRLEQQLVAQSFLDWCRQP
jgi:hypothetical protein